MRSRTIDRGMLLLGILLMLVSSYQLFFHGQDTGQSRTLGKLSSLASVVKTKSALTLDWKDAYLGNLIAENQLIYTDQKSSAEVLFDRGDQLIIGENSLIKISAKGNEASLDLERGVLRAKLEGKKPLIFELNGKEVSLEGQGAEVQINLNNSKGEIGVISGDVTVKKNGESSKIGPRVALSIDGQKIETKNIYFETQNPARDQIIYTATSATQVEFSWEPLEKSKVFLSHSADLAKAKIIEGGPGMREALSPGNYYWKVENEHGPSIISSFKIHLETAPKVLRPLTGEKIILPKLDNEEARLILQWQGEPGIKYLVEWEDSSMHSSSVQTESAVINVPQSGHLKWRVRIDDEKRILAQWSEWQDLEIVVLPPPTAPTNLLPDGIEYQTYKEPKENIEMSWTSSSPVEIELLHPDGHTDTKGSKESTMVYEAFGEGKYLWRARSLDSYGRISEWSDWKAFEIKDLSGATGIKGVQRIQLKRPDQLVTFNWEGSKETTSVFELSNDPNFAQVISKKEIKGNETKVVVPKIGSYYWRSRQFLPDGTVNSSEPIKVIIEPTPLPKKPQKLPDLEVPIEWKLFEQKSSWNLFDLIIPSAHAEEVRGVVKVELPAEEDAKAYHVKIFRDQQLTDLILEKTITTNVLEWEGVALGTYYWQYAIIDYWDRKSPYSDAATLTVTGEELRPPERARLRQPIRAEEVENEDINFKWTSSGEDIRYKLEISSEKDFKEVIYKKRSKETALVLPKIESRSGLHYWRVTAINSFGQETVSNIGRFIVKSELERIIIADQYGKVEWKKTWRNRCSISWAPSKDEYTFSDGETGNISGNALNGIEVKATFFQEKSMVNAEVLRQSGKVYESEQYLFQRALLDYSRSWTKNSGSRFNLGLALGQISGSEYSIETEGVKSKVASGLTYGPIFRSYHPLSERWELNTRGMYLLGEIKQIEASLEAIRTWRGSYYFTQGIGYGTRDYESSKGKQNSIRLSFGIGKEF